MIETLNERLVFVSHKHDDHELGKWVGDLLIFTHIVVILAGVYSSYSKWIDREVEYRFDRCVAAVRELA